MEEPDYDSLRGRYEHVYIQTGSIFEADCKAIERSLALSFSLYFRLSASGGLDQKMQHLAAFFYRNCVYLSATYHMLRNGMLDPAGNNMRTVFETVIWTYAYLTDEDIYSNFIELEKLETEKFALVKSGKWSNTKERSFENLRRKYNFRKMMKKMYSKELFEKFFFNQYWVLCQKSHSSIFGVNHNTPNMEGTTTLEKRPQEIKDNLAATEYLCAENLICFLNCFHTKMAQEDIDSVLTEINRVNKMIPPAIGLAPDTKKLEFTLRFREA
jgi:uncharacterized protein DUF5677